MDISDHLGKPKRFSSDGLVTENQKAQQMLQFAELSLRNKGPSFHNLTLLLMPLRYRVQAVFLNKSVFLDKQYRHRVSI